MGKPPSRHFINVLLWVAGCVVVLTIAQYGSVHLLTGRPFSLLFEAALDLGPPLLFPGDIVQLTLNKGSQAPLRDNPLAFLAGVVANIAVYGSAFLLLRWVFFSAPSSKMQADGEQH